MIALDPKYFVPYWACKLEVLLLEPPTVVCNSPPRQASLRDIYCLHHGELHVYLGARK